MSPEFTILFTRYIGYSYAKQLAFLDVLGERTWSVNIAEGRATFGDDLSYSIQLIGTEADSNSSWLWAWANEKSNIPLTLLNASLQLKALGEAQKVPELVERSCSLETANGHMIAMVISGLNPQCCYYRGPYNGGALFFLICDAPKEVTQPVAIERAITVINEIISQFELDHREMTDSFLRSQGFSIDSKGKTMVASRAGQSMVVTFDSLNRIENMQAELSPTITPKRSWWQFW